MTLIIRDKQFNLIEIDEIDDVDVDNITGMIKEIYNKEIDEIDDDIIVEFLTTCNNYNIDYIYDKNNVVEIEIDEILKYFLLNIIYKSNLIKFLINEIEDDYNYLQYYDIIDNYQYQIVNNKKTLYDIVDDLKTIDLKNISSFKDLRDVFYYYTGNKKLKTITFKEIVDNVKNNIDEVIKDLNNDDRLLNTLIIDYY